MKTKYILIAFIIVFSAKSFAQTDYYWSNGRKYFLNKQTNSFVVKFKEKEEYRISTANVKKINGIKRVDKLNKYLKIVTIDDNKLSKKALKNEKGIENLINSYSYIFMTGEILLEPNDISDIDKIIQLWDNIPPSNIPYYTITKIISSKSKK